MSRLAQLRLGMVNREEEYNIYFRNPILKLKETPTEQKDFFKELYNVLNKKEVKQKLNLILAIKRWLKLKLNFCY